MQQITFALPDLAWPHPHIPLPKLDTPGLNHLLHWGKPHSHNHGHNAAFFGRYLWQDSLLQNALSTLGLTEQPAAFWCSPLHQHIGMHSAFIMDGTVLHIQADEAATWCHELSLFFADAQWHFHPYRPDLWLVTCPQTPQWQAASILDLGQHIDTSNKPTGNDAAALLQAQTEIQMLLHRHTLNYARQQRGQMEINGVWFWHHVPGQASPHTRLLTHSVWAQNTLQPHPIPLHWHDFCKQYPTATTNTVIFDDSLMQAVAQGDAHAYAAQLQKWDHNWFMPAQRALASGQPIQLCISSQQACLDVRKPGLSPFWRRKPTFQGVWAS